MSLSKKERQRLLNNATPGLRKAALGDAIVSLEEKTATLPAGLKQGVAVPDAAAAPSKAEFDALLASLRAAGVIATA